VATGPVGKQPQLLFLDAVLGSNNDKISSVIFEDTSSAPWMALMDTDPLSLNMGTENNPYLVSGRKLPLLEAGREVEHGGRAVNG